MKQGWPDFWHKGKSPPWWARGLSWIYCALIALKRWLYRHKVFATTYFKIPIVVVGNRVVGGTGKTPFILALSRGLKAQGFQVGIVSRGYGRQSKGLQWVTEESNANEVGDEPLMLFKELNIPVVVAAQRVDAVEAIIEKAGVDLVISDDGWQHWSMGRDLVIEIVDGDKGYGNNLCLPAGPLREPTSVLSAPDFTLINGQDFHLKPIAWQHVLTGKVYPLSHIQGQVNAIAGIGNPERFFKTVTSLGLSLHHAQPLKDHQLFNAIDIHWDTAEMPLVMTLKDAVRYQVHAQAHWWALLVETSVDDARLQSIYDKLATTKKG